LPFPLECPAERERAGKRNRDPQDSGGSVLDRPTFPDEGEGKDQHA
jgi:hypothetical protein